MDLVWFQYSKWLKEQLPINRGLYFGKINVFNRQFSMPHPEIEAEEKKKVIPA
jgi:ATP-dependent DNA helicase RecG